MKMLTVSVVLALAAAPLAALAAPALPAAPAPAAAPAADALADLPGQVAGVVGSGDQMTLRLKTGDETRSLKLGDVYAQDWKLTALTAETATFSKNGQVRRIGLNPDGLVAQQAGPDTPSTVTTIGRAVVTTATVDQLLQRAQASGAAMPNMSDADKAALAARLQAMVNSPAGRAMPSNIDDAVAMYGQDAINGFLAQQAGGGRGGGRGQ